MGQLTDHDVTREEMAQACERAAGVSYPTTNGGYVVVSSTSDIADLNAVRAAAAELRKTCAGCKHQSRTSIGDRAFPWCIKWRSEVSLDGFCHRFEAKP